MSTPHPVIHSRNYVDKQNHLDGNEQTNNHHPRKSEPGVKAVVSR